jgi:uncharacterized protein with HEPN domain
MQPDDRTRLEHMLQAALEALSFAQGRTRADLDGDRQLTMALVKEIEIIGEAANEIAEATRASITEIPWPKVIGMRHRLVHMYYDINLTILWKTLEEDLPPLIEALEKVFQRMPK